MKICLPIEQPPVTSYPTIANTLSILWGYKEKVVPWLSDHFIQLVIRPNYELANADFYEHADLDNYFTLIHGCPLLGWMRNNRITASFTKFTEYIEYQIEHGYYVEPCLDNYYFKFTEYYGKSHFIHTTFVYGFDREKQEVYISDFYNGGKYTRNIVSYDEINKSIENVDYLINLYKFQNAEYNFNPKLMNLYMEHSCNEIK